LTIYIVIEVVGIIFYVDWPKQRIEMQSYGKSER